MGDTITLFELARLFEIVAEDPSSATGSAVAEWDYPLSREAAIFADLYDLQFAKTGTKGQKPYPRPWKIPSGETKRRGNAAGRTPEEVKAILAGFGHALVAGAAPSAPEGAA